MFRHHRVHRDTALVAQVQSKNTCQQPTLAKNFTHPARHSVLSKPLSPDWNGFFTVARHFSVSKKRLSNQRPSVLVTGQAQGLRPVMRAGPNTGVIVHSVPAPVALLCLVRRVYTCHHQCDLSHVIRTEGLCVTNDLVHLDSHFFRHVHRVNYLTLPRLRLASADNSRSCSSPAA